MWGMTSFSIANLHAHANRQRNVLIGDCINLREFQFERNNI